MEALYGFLQEVSNVVWGPIMLVLLVGTGLYLTVSLRFFSFRNWVRAYRCLWEGRKHQSEHGEVSPWNALMTALAADIGTGTIVGVATATALGGPGALFWMWVTALVGMMTNFSEVLLSVHFREKTPGWQLGGWGHVLHQERPGQKLYLAGHVLCRVRHDSLLRHRGHGPGQLHQRESGQDRARAGMGHSAGPAFLRGHRARRRRQARGRGGRLRPSGAVIYIVMCLIIIFMNIDRVPFVFWWVVSDAFTPTAAQGGFVGASVTVAIRRAWPDMAFLQ